MNTKIINDIEYIIYKSGMIINDCKKSYYFEDDLFYDEDVKCLHFYASKSINIKGNQYVRGNQYVGGNQCVEGYQDVVGYQCVEGYQDVVGYQYVVGNQYVGGNQYVVGNQHAGGNQYVGGNQDVGGNQYVGGYQDVVGNQYVGGYQYVVGNQYVGGYQDVVGYQYVGGYQDVVGYQDVRYIYLHLYCKYPILIDRDSDFYKIGCVKKTESEWISFFINKETINLSFDDRNYKKIEMAFNAAKLMKQHLILMNDKK